MNKMIKILLSVMIVSFSLFLIPLTRDNDKLKTETDSVQELNVVDIEIYSQNYSEPITQVLIYEAQNIYEIVSEEMNQELEKINTINDKKEWFLAYKSIIGKYESITEHHETIYDYFTENELDLLFRVVQAEVGDEYSFEQKSNVASVIFNRFEHDRFPDSLFEILIPSQFASISDGRYKVVEVSEDTILACEYAFSIEDTTNGCLFFDSNNKLKYKYVYNDGAHNFYTLEEK